LARQTQSFLAIRRVQHGVSRLVKHSFVHQFLKLAVFHQEHRDFQEETSALRVATPESSTATHIE
jgi:hypothetical protein